MPKAKASKKKKVLGEDLGSASFLESLREQAEVNRTYNARLKKKAKTYEELVVPVDCFVEYLSGTTSGKSITTKSEWRAGGSAPSYNAGDVQECTIDVRVDGTPIKHLYFKGWPPIQKGDTIRAYIFKGTEVRLKNEEEGLGALAEIRNPERVLVERDFDETEKPSKIEKLVNGEPVAEYFSK